MLLEEKLTSTSKNTNLKKISTVIGTIFYYLSIAAVGPLSAFAPYLVSYLYEFNSNLTIHYTYFIALILYITSLLFAPFGGLTDRYLGPHRSIVIGTMIKGIGAYCLITSKSLYLDYCILVFYGLGSAVSNGSVMKNVMMYYPKNRGLISGINMLFSSFGGAIFNMIGEMIINPSSAQVNDKKMYPFEVSKNITLFFIFQILVIIIFTFLSLLFIFPYEKEDNTNEEDNLTMDGLAEIEDVVNEESKNINQIKKAIKSWRFLRFCIILSCTSFVYLLLQTAGRVIGMSVNIKTIYLQVLGSLSLVVLCIFTPMWGYISDKFNFKYLLLLFNIGTAIISVSYLYCLKITVTYFIINLVVAFFGSGLAVILAPHLMKVYGMKYIIEIGGVMMISTVLSYIISSGFAFIVQSYLTDPNLSYQIMFLVSGGLAVLSTFLGWFEDDSKFVY